MPDSFWTYFFLGTSAFLAGVMNAVAGGGTLLTFPALTGVVTEGVANATSTIALLPGSVSGALGYRQEVMASKKFILRMFGPSLVGGALGAWLVTENEKAFKHLVPWLILTAAVLFLVQPILARVIRRHAHDTTEPGTAVQAGLTGFQFLVALYGGYFGAGIGILMLTTLGFMGVGDIHKMNGVKTVLAAVINASSVVIFVWQEMVDWRYAVAMAGASVLGGYAGARVSRRMKPAYVRIAVIVIAFGLASYYFLREFAGGK